MNKYFFIVEEREQITITQVVKAFLLRNDYFTYQSCRILWLDWLYGD